MEGWKKYEGKKVYIILKNNRRYSGVVRDIDEALTPIIFLTLKDKFNKFITFQIGEIATIEEEGKNG